MHDNDGAGDRRLEGRVRELETKVQALELSDAQHKIEIATVKGELSGLRSSSATSHEVKAASELLNVQLQYLHRDVAGIKTVLWWFVALIVAGFIAAVGNMVYLK